MLTCRVFSMVLTATSLVLLVIALITDYWLVAYGPKDIVHSGLWKWCRDGNCFPPKVTFDYIVATQAFLIMACLMSLAAVIGHITFFAPYDCGILDKPFFVLATAFMAGLFTLIAVAVFTAESWGKNGNPQIQLTFEWSFYLAWGAFPMLLLAAYIVFSIFFMLISAVTCYGSVIFGTLCLTGLPPPKKIKWTTLTISLCFMSGFTGGIGLFNFMRLSIEKAGTFLSWSLATGWFSVIVVCFAGVCHFVAKNWEEEAWAQALLGTTMVLTLQEDCMARTDSEDAQKKRRWAESDTSG